MEEEVSVTEDTMSYEDIVHNWGVLERYILDTEFKNTETRNYQELVKRVSQWIMSDEVLKHVPEAIRSFISGYRQSYQQFLEVGYVVPSSAILRYAGTDEKDKNYFSYYLASTLEKFVDLSAHACSGTEIGYQSPLDQETDSDLHDVITALSSPDVSVTVREDGSLMDSFLRVTDDTVQRNFIFYHEVLDQLGIARSICAKQTVGISFAQNFKKKSIISDSILPFYTTANPGYMGPNGTACPMFYINVSEIIASSEDFTTYLQKVNEASFIAALLANIVLVQPDGFLDESMIEKTLKYRPVGVGIFGLHAAMIRCDVPYESDVGIEFAEQTQASVTLGTMTASAELMMLSSKTLRVSHKPDILTNLVFKCESVLSSDLDQLVDYTPLKESIRKHGCLYNLTTTVQGYDPILSRLLHVSTEGVEPLSSIEMIKDVHDEQSVILFPLEIFDNQHNMTCNLHALKEQTFPYVSMPYKIRLLSRIQDFSHSPVASALIAPVNMDALKIVELIKHAVSSGLYHIKIRLGTYFSQEKTYTEENEVSEPQVIENEDSTDLSDSDASLLPSPFDSEQVNLEMKNEESSFENSEMKPMAEVSVSQAKVYNIKDENVWLSITITDDGKQIMIAPHHSSEDVKISILGSLNEFNLSGLVNDGKVRF